METTFKPWKLLSVSGLSAVITFSIASPVLAQFSAIAQGVNGWGWASGHSTMERARNAAIRQCRGRGGGSCSVSTAERDSWFFVGGYCDGVPYTAASPHSWQDAADFMRQKARKDWNYNCYIDVER